MTVLLSSHLMDEVEELCNRVAIVRAAAIVYEGALDELLRLGRPAATSCGRPTTRAAAAICAAQPGHPRRARRPRRARASRADERRRRGA